MTNQTLPVFWHNHDDARPEKSAARFCFSAHTQERVFPLILPDLPHALVCRFSTAHLDGLRIQRAIPVAIPERDIVEPELHDVPVVVSDHRFAFDAGSKHGQASKSDKGKAHGFLH